VTDAAGRLDDCTTRRVVGMVLLRERLYSIALCWNHE
jgi:hypothetical protein